MRLIKLLVLATLLCANAVAQNVPAPRQPSNGPSLEATMKFIQDGMEGVNFSYAMDGGGTATTSNVAVQITSVQGDAATCKLTWQERVKMNVGDGLFLKYDREVTFKDVNSVKVESRNTSPDSEGKRFTPDVYLVKLNGALGKKFPVHVVLEMPTPKKKHRANDAGVTQTPGDSMVPFAEVQFTDEKLAKSMAKAMWHAVELCGGGEKSLF